MVEVTKFSGKSQESLRSPTSLILAHSILIRSSLELIKERNLSFFVLGADVDESRCFEGGKLVRFFRVGSLEGDKEEELKTGWGAFARTTLVEVEGGGEGGSQRWRKVKKEEKKITGVNNGLKIIPTKSWR